MEEKTRKKPWWETKISYYEPNKLVIRGYRLDDMIGRISYGEMLYLMIKGELPPTEVRNLIDALLIAGCDHGVTPPSVYVARMAATCGIPLNCAVASGINLLGDIHGGAIEQAMKLYYEIDEKMKSSGRPIEEITKEIVQEYKLKHLYIPGFGHRVHTRDPRPRRLFELAKEVQGKGHISGKYVAIAEGIEKAIQEVLGKHIPYNVDGGMAAIACELGFPWEVGKGIFLLSRGLGITAHAFEEKMKGTRLKIGLPPDLWTKEIAYNGVPERELPAERFSTSRKHSQNCAYI